MTTAAVSMTVTSCYDCPLAENIHDNSYARCQHPVVEAARVAGDPTAHSMHWIHSHPGTHTLGGYAEIAQIVKLPPFWCPLPVLPVKLGV